MNFNIIIYINIGILLNALNYISCVKISGNYYSQGDY